MSKKQEADMGVRYAMLFAALIAIALLVPPKAAACEWLEVGAAVYHWDRTKDYNERGPLVGCEYRNYSFRYFENSHRWDTFAVTKNIQLVELGAADFGLEVGLVRGYRDKVPSITDLLNPKLFKGSDGLARELDKIGLWLVPRFDFPLQADSRVQVFILGSSGVAATIKWNINPK